MKKRWWLLLGSVLVAGFVAVGIGQWGETAVRGKSPAQRLSEPLNRSQQLAQNIALSHADVQNLTQGQRSEVFNIKNVGQHTTPNSAACAETACQQVEIYNFDSNSTVTAIVDTASETVLDVLYQPRVQPGINKRLADKAIEIALNHPDIIAELGYQPTQVDMAPVAAGMVGSVCEEHLCAGPTFEVNGRILWAIIDLTEEELVGLNWTEVPNDGRPVVQAQGGGCPEPGVVDRDGWSLAYETTGTDGLRVFDAAFNGRSVLNSAKLAEWHVDYNGTYHIAGFLDVTGCGGTGGFFILPTGETQLLDLVEESETVGFELVQDFRMPNWGADCNYRYEQRMQFYEDGRFRIASGAYGRGCGFFPVYRSVVRIDLALDDADQEQLGYWSGEHWIVPENELYLTPDVDSHGAGGHPVGPNGAMLWQMNQDGSGYYMLPGAGQFDEIERGDAAFVYFSRFDAAEGAADIPVFGGLCCNDDHQQGPHYFINDEPIQNDNIVLWYVAQHQTEVSLADPSRNYCWAWFDDDDNVQTVPCFGGPMFVPFENSGVFTPTFDIASTEVLFPETAVFTNTSIISTSFPINNVWHFGNGQTSFAESPTHQYLLNGTFTPTLTIDAFANGRATFGETAVTVQVNNQFLPAIRRE